MSEHEITSDTGNCTLTREWVGKTAIVAAAGVVDMVSAPQLQEAIRAALGEEPAALLVDFSDVDFLASAGMGVLVSAHDEKPETVALGIVADGPATSRPLKLVGIAEMIGLYATRDEALAAVTA